MAKKKAPKKTAATPATGPVPVASLTAAQVNTLAGRLYGTHGNVYRMLESAEFNAQPDEAIFDRLDKEQNLLRCINCDLWVDRKQGEIDTGSEMCNECLDGVHEDDLDDGDDD